MEKSKITKAMVLTAIKEADLTKVDFGAEVTASVMGCIFVRNLLWGDDVTCVMTGNDVSWKCS